MVEIAVANFQRRVRIDTKALKMLAAKTVGNRKGRLSIAIVGRKRMRTLNRQFRGHDALTDVLSFDLGEDSKRIEGEVVVCSDAAISEARRLGTDPAGEVALYVVHGLLHLLGMEDATAKGSQRMHRRALRLVHEAGWRDVE